jgi:hypothetical protein
MGNLFLTTTANKNKATKQAASSLRGEFTSALFFNTSRHFPRM